MKLLNNIKSVLSNSMSLVAFALMLAVFLGYTYFEPNNKIQILINESLGYSYQTESVVGNTTGQAEEASPLSVISQEPIAGLKAQWGVIGDFFGGILNPIFALIGLFLLARTLKINSEELASTRKELEESRKVYKTQQFENTFFNLLSTITEQEKNCKKDIDECFEDINSLGEPRFDGIEHTVTPDSIRSMFYPRNKNICQLFMNIYQILKITDDSIEHEEDKKTYTNIVRANLNNDTLALLLINNASEYDIVFDRYKDMTERFSLMEHIDLSAFIQNIAGREGYIALAYMDYYERRNEESERELNRYFHGQISERALQGAMGELSNRKELLLSILKIINSYNKKTYGKSIFIDNNRKLIEKLLIMMKKQNIDILDLAPST